MSGSSFNQPSLHEVWLAEAINLGVPEQILGNMGQFLEQMRMHHVGTYEHSMRVGLLAPKIGAMVPELAETSPRALFYAGTMHDRGKLKTPKRLLEKTSEWTEEDARALRPHPLDSYAAVGSEGMALTAGVVVLHHSFQPNAYPEEIPAPHPNLPARLIALQPILGSVLALADFYDASHRNNSAGNLSADQIRANVYEARPDVTDLIDRLYDEGIFV